MGKIRNWIERTFADADEESIYPRDTPINAADRRRLGHQAISQTDQAFNEIAQTSLKDIADNSDQR